MTKDEIMKLEAGQEINELVINHVMKWALIHRGDFDYTYNDGVYGARINWSPSSEIADAWIVVEKMQSKGFCFDADGNALRKRFRFGVGQEIGEAETAPLAICRAALLAIMETKEHE